MSDSLLSARGLVRSFGGRKASLLGPEVPTVQALRGVDLDLYAGKTVGVIGESGSGKSTLARLMLRLDHPTAGELQFDGRCVSDMDRAASQEFCRRIQPVFQSPYASLNPRMVVRDIIAEPLLTVTDIAREAAYARVDEVLDLVGLPRDSGLRNPAEFSGGQRQRIAIARAISVTPDLVILDEPVASLDTSVRAQVLNLLRDIQRTSGTGYMLITHDLTTLRAMCDTIAVMYLGRIVELGPAEDVCTNPKHPYTKSLLGSCLTMETARQERIPPKGEPPSPVAPPPGCSYHPRCPVAVDGCARNDPALELCDDQHVACSEI